jgi:1-acyl-sn-glycerol-3-phosphate acyltransferase
MQKEGVQRWRYRHADYRLRRALCRFLLRTIAFTALVKIDRVSGLENIPSEGPGILLINHIAFVDPIVVLHVMPRDITPMAKVEVYEYPVIGIFPRLWGVIPVRREEVDRRAIQMALEVLQAGEIILVAPEGTRGPELQRGKEGMAYLASRGDAPIIPVAIEGTPGFPALRFSSRWRQTGVQISFGRPFYYREDLKRAGREELRQMADEAMYILAAMLPERRRGVYSDLSRATEETIVRPG